MSNKVILTILFICSLIGCKQNAEINSETLEGKWSVLQASRDGQPTKTLESAYFDFTKNGKVSSNILQSTDNIDYSIDGNFIHIKDATPFTLAITNFQKDTMNAEGLLGSYKVELQLAK
jgi:hypothetical protein